MDKSIEAAARALNYELYGDDATEAALDNSRLMARTVIAAYRDAEIERLTALNLSALKAMIYTQDYIGPAMRPLPGWGWYDSARAIADAHPESEWAKEFFVRDAPGGQYEAARGVSVGDTAEIAGTLAGLKSLDEETIAELRAQLAAKDAEVARLRAIPRIDDLAAMNLLADRACEACSCDIGETCAYCEVDSVLNEIGSIIDEWKRAALKD